MYFKDEYYFLSNMYPCPIAVTINGIPYVFSCVEAAFQAHKSPGRASEFVGIDGYTAKKLGRGVVLRRDWEDIKVQLMYSLVTLKFKDPVLFAQLKAIQEWKIVEENTWGDTFWGMCNGVGDNHLGKILMAVRDGQSMCFTGRRPKDLYGYNHDSYIPVVEAIKACLREHVVQGYNTFISGGAQGFDQLAFWAVNALKKEGYLVRNVVYVPFAGQEKAWKEEGLFSQKEYRLMLRLADEIRILRQIDTTNKQEVVEALHGRNHAMVDDADAVFGLYPDDNWILPTTKGGTAECLKYAHSQRKQIYRLSPEESKGQWIWR